MTENTIPVEAQRQIIQAQIEAWRNTRYHHRLDYKVKKGIGWNEKQLAEIEKELKACEAAIDLLRQELALLDNAPAGAEGAG